MKYVTLMKLSEEGRKRYAESATLLATCFDIVDKAGGKVLENYAIVGPYDFFAVSDYPTLEAHLEVRVKMFELGVFDELVSYEAFEMETYLAKL